MNINSIQTFLYSKAGREYLPDSHTAKAYYLKRQYAFLPVLTTMFHILRRSTTRHLFRNVHKGSHQIGKRQPVFHRSSDNSADVVAQVEAIDYPR